MTVLNTIRSKSPPWMRIGRGTIYYFITLSPNPSQSQNNPVIQALLSATRLSGLTLSYLSILLVGSLALIGSVWSPEIWIDGALYPLVASSTSESTALTAGIVALVLSVGLHEWGHYVCARAAGVSVNETGIVTICGVLPLGLYVSIDGGAWDACDLWSKQAMLSGGIAVNVLLIGASLALLAVTGNWAVISESYREPIGLLSLTTVIIASMIPINAAFIISNALPLPGMDGSHLLNSGQSRDESRLREPDILAGTTLAGLAITAYTGSVLPTIAGVIITLSLMLYYRNATVNSLIGAT